MTAGTDSHPNDPHVKAPGRVRQVTLPPAARALSTLSHFDYEDAFLVETGPAQDRTGEQWARAILKDAPMSTRNALSRGWSALGLRFGSTQSDRFVLGWEVRRSTPDVALLGASDLNALMRALAPDVTVWADGKARAAGAHPVHGHDKVARLIISDAFRHPIPDLAIRYRRVNGEPSALLMSGSTPYMLVYLDLVPNSDQVRGIYVVSNPEKIANLG